MAALLPEDVLIQLLGYGFEPWSSSGWYPAVPPTPNSIERIYQETGVKIPNLMIRMATECTSYGGWFGSIGEDSHNGNHLLVYNAYWHQEGLPKRYVIFNHGHDEDCDCWDTESPAEAEYPIVYVQISDDGAVNHVTPLAPGMAEYLDHQARSHAPRCPVKALRRRAKRLLAAYPELSNA